MIITLLQIVFGLLILALSADRLVDHASDIASHYGMSALMVGLTVVAFGTSAPEMIVSIMAVLADSGELAVGNALGSNIANLGLILGIAALVASTQSPLKLQTSLAKKELPLLIVMTLAAGYALYDLQLTRLEGALLLSGQAAFFWVLLKSQKATASPSNEEEYRSSNQSTRPIYRRWLGLGISLGLLLASSNVLVSGATALSLRLGVPEAVVGVSVIAIGTSLPELAATLASIKKQQQDLAVGNIIGSNIMNITLVLSMAGLLKPTIIEATVFLRDYSLALTLTLSLAGFYLLSPKQGLIRHWQGAAWVTSYGAYISYLVYTHL